MLGKMHEEEDGGKEEIKMETKYSQHSQKLS